MKHTRNKSQAEEKVFSAHQILLFFFVPLMVVVLATASTAYLNISQSDYINFQVDWFLSLNHFLSEWPLFWLNMTHLGDAFVFIPLMSFFVIRYPQVWAALFGAVPLASILSGAGKSLFSIPRPAAVLEPDLFTIVGSALSSNTSLPSGHTITIFAGMTVIIVGVFFQNYHQKQYYFRYFLAATLAVLVAISRVGVGAHWPLDLLLGAALGVLSGVSGVILTQKFTQWWAWIGQVKYKFVVSGIILFLVASLTARMIDHDEVGILINWLSIVSGLSVIYYLLRQKSDADL